jgi:small subunit ribosomal protein S16
MKMMGRKHRPYFRICAVDSRRPRDGRVLEELGTYDPMVNDTDARALLNAERIDYWLSVGAQPSDRVRVLIKKYGTNGTNLSQQQTARERLAMPKAVPDAGEPVYVRPAPVETPAPEPAKGGKGKKSKAAVASAGGDAAGEAPASETSEASQPASAEAEAPPETEEKPADAAE